MSPVVVLVRPEMAANVGFAARCLACYGVSELRIVGRPGINNSVGAARTGKGAAEILKEARHFWTLAEAVADCRQALGFTRRARDPAQALLDLPEAASMPWEGRTALVFGPEAQGLTREDSLCLSHLVRIPMPSSTLSLNLSHAVAVALYAFGPSSARAAAESPQGAGRPSLGDAERILASVLSLMETKGAFKAAKAGAQSDYLRILWQRLQPTKAEVDFLAGVLKKIAE